MTQALQDRPLLPAHSLESAAYHRFINRYRLPIYLCRAVPCTLRLRADRTGVAYEAGTRRPYVTIDSTIVSLSTRADLNIGAPQGVMFLMARDDGANILAARTVYRLTGRDQVARMAMAGAFDPGFGANDIDGAYYKTPVKADIAMTGPLDAQGRPVSVDAEGRAFDADGHPLREGGGQGWTRIFFVGIADRSRLSMTRENSGLDLTDGHFATTQALPLERQEAFEAAEVEQWSLLGPDRQDQDQAQAQAQAQEGRTVQAAAGKDAQARRRAEDEAAAGRGFDDAMASLDADGLRPDGPGQEGSGLLEDMLAREGVDLNPAFDAQQEAPSAPSMEDVLAASIHTPFQERVREPVRDAVPEDAVPEEAVPEGAAPEGAAPGETVPEDAASEDAVPEETASEDAVQEDAVPEEADDGAGDADDGTVPEAPAEVRGDRKARRQARRAQAGARARASAAGAPRHSTGEAITRRAEALDRGRDEERQR